MGGSEKKPRERRIRFVPGKGSYLFAQAQPFHATLKDTGDPRIKKLTLDARTTGGDELLQIGIPPEILTKLKREAREHGRSAAAQAEEILERYFRGELGGGENPLDRVFFNIMEAAELTLDAAGPDLQTRIFAVLREAFRTLTELRRGGNFASPRAQQQLKAVLDELRRLRDLADEAEHSRK